MRYSRTSPGLSVLQRDTHPTRHDRETLCPVKVLPLQEKGLPLLRPVLPGPPRSYGLMRQTWILCSPLPSLRVTVFAGCCEPRLGIGPSRRYLHKSVPRCLVPYPGSPLVHALVSSRRAAAFPTLQPGRRPTSTRTVTSVRTRFRGCSHSFSFRPRVCSRCRSPQPQCPALGCHRFCFPAYLGLLPPRAGDMLAVRIGQLTARGLTSR
jgi:hypothetical protein